MGSIELIREFLRDRLDVAPERVTLEATLEALGVDSLMLLELMFAFEDHSGIKLSEDIKPPPTVGGLVTLMDGLIQGQKG